jgi:hypothetical protein
MPTLVYETAGGFFVRHPVFNVRNRVNKETAELVTSL